MVIVADSSPLISFAILDHLSLLDKLFDKIAIPMAVYNELVQPSKPFADRLKVFLDGRVISVHDVLAVNALRQQVDFGEAEAMVLALEHKIADILIDDYKGRQVAKTMGLNPVGTLGVLLQAKEKKFIPNVRELMDMLMINNIRIGKDLYQHALLLSGEIKI